MWRTAHHVAHAATAALLLISPWRVSVSSSYTKLFCGRRGRTNERGGGGRGENENRQRRGENEEGLTQRLIPIAFFFSFATEDDGVPSAALLAFAHSDTLSSLSSTSPVGVLSSSLLTKMGASMRVADKEGERERVDW